MGNVTIKPYKHFTLNVPAFVDEYGFTPEEFRVFARIMRRAGENGVFFESVTSMSDTLQISERLVRRALRVLQGCKAILVFTEPGRSTQITVNPSDRWVSSLELLNVRQRICGTQKERDRERKMEENRPLAETQPLAETTGVPLAETQPEGYPYKVLNLAETANTLNPEKEKRAPSDHALGMKFLYDTLGAFPDGGAQGKALKWMLSNNATLQQVKDGLVRHVREVNGKYRPSYTTLQKVIFQWTKPLPIIAPTQIDLQGEAEAYARRFAE